MSRIGNKLIPVPKGVKVDIQGAKVVVTGPKGRPRMRASGAWP
jgi:ribosomal protein L6P/L9E